MGRSGVIRLYSNFYWHWGSNLDFFKLFELDGSHLGPKYLKQFQLWSGNNLQAVKPLI